MRTVSSSTRATTRAMSGWRSWPTRTASGAAGPSSTVSTRARAVSTSPARSWRSRGRWWSARSERSRGRRRPPADHPDRRPGAERPDAPPLATISEALGRQTNNVAEWTAVVHALDLAAELGAEEVLLLLDSMLVVEQEEHLF